MPIEVDSEIRIFSQDEFHSLSHRVLGVAFGVHNQFGRLMNEEIYKQAIRRRCETAGISPARREVQISVRHGSFEKRGATKYAGPLATLPRSYPAGLDSMDQHEPARHRIPDTNAVGRMMGAE